MKSAVAALLLLSCASPVPSGEVNNITVHALTDLDGIMYLPEPRPNGIFVLVSDESPSTTHFSVTVEYEVDGVVRSQSFTPQKVYYPDRTGYTTMLFNTGQKPKLLKITVFAFSLTGFRTVTP